MLQKYITLYEMMQKEITEDKIINMPVERYVSRLGFPTCERCLFLYYDTHCAWNVCSCVPKIAGCGGYVDCVTKSIDAKEDEVIEPHEKCPLWNGEQNVEA